MKTDDQPTAREGKLDGPMRAALIGVVGAAVLLSLGALAAAGGRFALGVAIGGALAPLNLWVFAQVGEAFLSRKGRTAPWAAIAVVKLIVLMGGVWLILRSGIASGLSLALGYAALPMGITVGTLFGPKPPDDDGSVSESQITSSGSSAEGDDVDVSRRSFGNAPPEDVLKARPADGGDPD